MNRPDGNHRFAVSHFPAVKTAGNTIARPYGTIKKLFLWRIGSSPRFVSPRIGKYLSFIYENKDLTIRQAATYIGDNGYFAHQIHGFHPWLFRS